METLGLQARPDVLAVGAVFAAGVLVAGADVPGQ